MRRWMASERVSIDLSRLRAQISQFAEDRNWEQFHRPKNLAMALAAEAESPRVLGSRAQRSRRSSNENGSGAWIVILPKSGWSGFRM